MLSVESIYYLCSIVVASTNYFYKSFSHVAECVCFFMRLLIC